MNETTRKYLRAIREYVIGYGEENKIAFSMEKGRLERTIEDWNQEIQSVDFGLIRKQGHRYGLYVGTVCVHAAK